jgi:hypothetical protein
MDIGPTPAQSSGAAARLRLPSGAAKRRFATSRKPVHIRGVGRCHPLEYKANGAIVLLALFFPVLPFTRFPYPNETP